MALNIPNAISISAKHEDIDLEALSVTETFVEDLCPEQTERHETDNARPIDAFPEDDALPPQVRQYLTLVLYAVIGDVTPSGATAAELADKWEYGKGEELRTYDESMFQSIFGSELGKVLAKEIKKRYQKHELQQKTIAEQEPMKSSHVWLNIGCIAIQLYLLGWACYGVQMFSEIQPESTLRRLPWIGIVLASLMTAFITLGVSIIAIESIQFRKKESKKDSNVGGPLLAESTQKAC